MPTSISLTTINYKIRLLQTDNTFAIDSTVCF